MSTSDPTKAPSLQHILCHFEELPVNTAGNLIVSRDQPRTISVLGARKYAVSFLSGDKSYEWLIKQAKADPSYSGRAAYEILPLLKQYTEMHRVEAFQPVHEMHYEICPGLILPIQIYGRALVDDELKIIHCQIWKHKSLNAYQFSMWWAIAQRAIAQYFPEVSALHWLEMSVVKGKLRELRVRDEAAARFVSDRELINFRDHMELAIQILRDTPRPKRKPGARDPRQSDLFGNPE